MNKSFFFDSHYENKKLLSRFLAIAMMSGVAQAQIPATMSWNFHENDVKFEMGESWTLTAEVDGTAYWNDLPRTWRWRGSFLPQ